MATAVSTRVFTRSALRAAHSSSRSLARPTYRFLDSAKISNQQFRRSYATEPPKASPNFEAPKSESSAPPPPPPPPSGLNGTLVVAIALAGIGGGAYLAYSNWDKVFSGAKAAPFAPKFEDYQKVYDIIATKLQDEDDYDDGSYGPVLLRLAWHSSGTYDKETNTGGSNGATMRFQPEGDHGANAGLLAARNFLEPIQKQFPWISYGDLWTLAGVCAIQEMQGPIIPWRPGRQDATEAFCTPDGRLPDASKTQDHVRGIFYRMGFNDREIVALSGAHALGRCHTDRSGYTGPWTFSPITMTNDYFRLLVEEKWQWKKWNGPAQYEDVKTKTLMMLPSDMAIVKDKEFLKTTKIYARDNDAFFSDFSAAIVKLFELGVPFAVGEEGRFRFKPAE